MNPTHVGKQGNISQLGGDFIFGPGEKSILHALIWIPITRLS